MSVEEAMNAFKEWIERDQKMIEYEDRLENIEIYKLAIKALEQISALDHARAEIESQREEVIKKYFENAGLSHYYIGLNDGLKYSRNIIDKYMGSENKE